MKSSTEAGPNPPQHEALHHSAESHSSSDFSALAPQLVYLPAADIELVRGAFYVSRDAHAGQFRKSGDPYISHPLAVAGILAAWHLDAQALPAALLHDVVQDTPATTADIQARFNIPTKLFAQTSQ